MKSTAFVGADRVSVFNRLRALCLTLVMLVSSSAIAATTLERIVQDGAIKLGYQIAPPSRISMSPETGSATRSTFA